MSQFLKSLKARPLLGDGAMGTMLVRHGLGRGENPELWMLSHPEEIKKIHHAYLAAGSQVLQTNTFGANSLKLQDYQVASKVKEINLTAAKLAREVVGNSAFVAGIIGPTGHFPAPLGDITWSDLVDVFKEQAIALEEGGVDFLFLETFLDLGEIRAALFAAKTYTSLPVACSLTYTKGRTLTGTTPEVAAVVLSAMGADLIGANCSTGPQDLLEVMKAYRQYTNLPLLVEPNAGMPELVNGETVFRETPEHMSAFVEPFIDSGVSLIGACCGSTPEHIRAMSEKMSAAIAQQKHLHTPAWTLQFPTRLSSRTKIVKLGQKEAPVIIGERINPTARKLIAEAYRSGNWSVITEEGLAQIEAGAPLLDVNVGVPGLKESNLLVLGVRHLQMALDIPLVLDCTSPEALEKGLQEYQGKALINSVNGEEKSLEAILPLAKRYGAAVLGLTLDEKGIPETAEGRLKIAEKILQRAHAHGLPKEDVLIDCLVLTAAVSSTLAMETIRAISLVKQHLGLTTALGLSNVSHGLPQRSWLNSSFLALAIAAGLDAAIANPLDARIKETLFASTLLAGKDPGAKAYLTLAGSSAVIPAATAASHKEASLEALNTCIFNGQQEKIVPLVKELLTKTDLLSIIHLGIIPPLEKIGNLFANGEAYLPQLMLSGDAAKAAFDFLKQYLPDNASAQKGTIVIGTVKGDVHDIGKNITAALLENHGYRVIDLGKNVPADEFLRAAKKEKAEIVGLSALMTTTMIEMQSIIDIIKKEDSRIKIIVGGAVVTPEFAREIGADGYGKDAVEAVRIVAALLKEN